MPEGGGGKRGGLGSLSFEQYIGQAAAFGRRLLAPRHRRQGKGIRTGSSVFKHSPAADTPESEDEEEEDMADS